MRDFLRLLLTGILAIFIGNKRVEQKHFLAVKFSAYNFTFPAAKTHSDNPVAYRFWGLKKIFLESFPLLPHLISRSGSGTYHNVLISLCIKGNCCTTKTTDWSLWDQQWPRGKWESFIFHLFVVHLLQSVTLLIHFTVYWPSTLAPRMKMKMVRSELTYTCVIVHALGLVFLLTMLWKTKRKNILFLLEPKFPHM